MSKVHDDNNTHNNKVLSNKLLNIIEHVEWLEDEIADIKDSLQLSLSQLSYYQEKVKVDLKLAKDIALEIKGEDGSEN